MVVKQVEASAKEVSKEMSILLKALVMMKRLARAVAMLVLLLSTVLRKGKARTRKKTGSWFSVLVAFENASQDPIDFWRTTVATWATRSL